MGDNKMRNIRYKHEMLIDYPFTNLKSESMDLYLIKNCEFYIGMQSGILDVALLFNKPILTLNMYTWFFAYPLKLYDRGLLKKIKFKNGRTSKVLSIKEHFELSYKYTNAEDDLKDDITFIENSSNEILYATNEFLLDYKSKFSRKPSSKQDEINNIFRKYSESIMLNEFPEKSKSFFSLPPIERTRVALRNLSSKGFLYELQ
jgi:putative glycosyltransferase (TIGR04372 family)